LFLSIINNLSGGLVTSEIQFLGIPNPNLYSELLLDIDKKTSGTLVWVGNNPSGLLYPLIIHI
jgi:hypothetical protein